MNNELIVIGYFVIGFIIAFIMEEILEPEEGVWLLIILVTCVWPLFLLASLGIGVGKVLKRIYAWINYKEIS